MSKHVIGTIGGICAVIIGNILSFTIGIRISGFFLAFFIGYIAGLGVASFLEDHTDIDFTENEIKIPEISKINISELVNPNEAQGRRAYRADTKSYLGVIESMDISKGKCEIKNDFGNVIAKSFSEILIEENPPEHSKSIV